MLIALVTGSMGAGKSSALAALKAKSCSVFQADKRVEDLLKPQSPCYAGLKRLFGEESLTGPGQAFDKKKLAEKIFKDSKKRKAAEAIIHPLVRKSLAKFAKDQKKQGKSKVFYEAPLISERLFDFADKSLLIVCPKEIRKKRLLAKGWAEKDIEARCLAQIPESRARKFADFIIDNSGSLKSLERQISRALSLMDSI